MSGTIKEQKTNSGNQRVRTGPLDMELEFLWEDRDPAGNRYDLYLGRISRNPVVRSHVTGKYFMLPWSEIIELAVNHGIARA
jgi:hypothetical protein